MFVWQREHHGPLDPSFPSSAGALAKVGGAENFLCMVIFRRSKEESQDNALKDEYGICQGLPLTAWGPGPRVDFTPFREPADWVGVG